MVEATSAERAQRETVYLKPSLIVLSGLPLAGKSTVGQEIARLSNLILLDIDQTRKDISNPTTTPKLPEDKERQQMFEAYVENYRRAQDLILKGHPVILAATFSSPKSHEDLVAFAQRLAVPVRVFQIIADESDVNKRLTLRSESSFSNVLTFEHYEEVRDRFYPMDIAIQIYNSKEPPQKAAQEIINCLKDLQ